MQTVYKFLSPLLLISVFISDRLTKEWVIRRLYIGETIDLLPVFQITYIENTGIAFGFGQNKNLYFMVISIVLIVFLLVLHHQSKSVETLLFKTGLALVIGGALGNLYDRIAYGSVIDFLDFFIGTHHWPAFNIADSAVFAGACLFLIAQVRQRSRQSAPTDHPVD